MSALGHRLELKLSQKLILTPQLQMAIKLLQMPQLELTQALTVELTENPFLEEIIEEKEELSREETESIEAPDDQSDDTEAPLEKFISTLTTFSADEYFDNRGSDGRDLGYFTPGTIENPSFEEFATKEVDIYEHLLWQLNLSDISEDMKQIGEMIIGNIDETGYLRATDEDIAESVSCDIGKVRSVISLIQGFDPSGIAARNLQECLLLQLGQLNLSGTIVEQIIRNNMADLGRKKYLQLARQYNVPMGDIMTAVRIIEDMEPKPARNFLSAYTAYIVPDVYVVKAEDSYQIVLNDDGIPRVRINNYYRKLFMSKNSLSKEDKQFVEEKLRSAVWLLKSLDQRNKTIYRVTESLVGFQRDFFDYGVSHLKPLNLRDIAMSLDLHESTISRVTSNKYLSCSHGIFSFRFFFSSALQSSEGTVSSTSVKDIIKKMINEEDSRKPLSDQRITELLKTKDISIARRTIAKYREELKIPSQGQRKRHD